MSRFVRQSSYRHVFGTPAKPEGQYLGVRPNLAGDGNCIAVNPTYFALPKAGGGGPIHIQPLKVTGRLSKTTDLAVHKSTVLDVQFSPFVDNVIASADDNALVRVTSFPTEFPHDGGELSTESAGVSSVALEGHGKRVTLLAWNPIAENIVASVADDGQAIVWDVNSAKSAYQQEISDDVYKHVAWNTTGSLLATTSKEKKAVQIWDPRDSKTAQTFAGAFGPKKSSFIFADNVELYITAGTNARAGRAIQLHDPRNLDKAVHTTDLDSSPGLLNVHYDPDNTILWVLGKGDGRIRYYEVVKTEKTLFALSEYQDSNSQKTGVFFPKRCLDTKTCEIARALRVLGDTIVPVSFQVPRKSDLFQKDLYPDTFAGVPSLTAAEYLSGKNGEPKLISMKPGTVAAEGPKATAIVAHKSASEYEAEIAQLKAKIAELEARLPK